MSNKHVFAFALFAFLAIGIGQARAYELYPDNISVGTIWGHYDYSEKLDPPNKSDESGNLFGYRVEYAYRMPNSLYIGLNGEWLDGKTKYDGSLQDGTPAKGHTNNTILRYEGLVGWTVLPVNYLLITPYVGYGQLEWERHLGGALPYDETYRWKYIPLGITTTYDLTNHLNIGFTGQADLVIDSEIKIDAADFGTKMGIGKKTQYSLEFPITYQFADHWLVALTPFYLNRPSNSSKATSIGNDTVIIEPESKSTFTGMRFTVKGTF